MDKVSNDEAALNKFRRDTLLASMDAFKAGVEVIETAAAPFFNACDSVKGVSSPAQLHELAEQLDATLATFAATTHDVSASMQSTYNYNVNRFYEEARSKYTDLFDEIHLLNRIESFNEIIAGIADFSMTRLQLPLTELADFAQSPIPDEVDCNTYNATHYEIFYHAAVIERFASVLRGLRYALIAATEKPCVER